MPNYQVINELPVLSFRTPIGKVRRLCADCLKKKFCNEPPAIQKDFLACCECCEEIKTCATYEAKRLQAIPPKKRARQTPIAERMNVIRRKKVG